MESNMTGGGDGVAQLRVQKRTIKKPTMSSIGIIMLVRKPDSDDTEMGFFFVGPSFVHTATVLQSTGLSGSSANFHGLFFPAPQQKSSLIRTEKPYFYAEIVIYFI